jgi:hypothetical protein
MPWCSQRRSGPKLLACPGKEGDDIVPGHRLDGVDRLYVDVAEDIVVIGLPDGRGVLGGDHADPAHRLRREHLDLPPDAEAVLGRPDGGHFCAGIAWDHSAAASRGRRMHQIAGTLPIAVWDMTCMEKRTRTEFGISRAF